ncbi:MAG: peptide-N-glycosidase F-related protein [Flavobacteriales bacterium]
MTRLPLRLGLHFGLWAAIAGLLASCQAGSDIPALGDHTVTLWSGDTLAFVPGRTVDTVLTNRGDYRLDAGRIRLKPIALPHRDRQCAITVDVSLRSAGDPWDKSGTLFAFADAAGRDYLQRMQDGGDADTTRFAGILSGPDETNREPALELLRFITPFGVGHFSHTERAQAYKPESVGAWADSVHWSADLSPIQSWLTDADTLWVGVYIDTWTAEGYTLSASITMDESDLPCDAALTQTTRPLLNTTKLAHDQRPYTAFAEGLLSVPFTLDAPAEGATLDFLTTGHGGHAGGDEFTEQEHILLLDSDTLKAWTPWRTDCGAYRRFNPTSGFWPSTYVYGGDTLEERVASSDLSRSNWCPGDDVQPLRLALGDLAAGEHTLEIAIPGAQAWTDSTFNFWNIAATLHHR